MRSPRLKSSCRIEPLEARLLLVIPGTRPAPDPLDEAILFRLPLATDTTTHFYFDRNGAAAGDIAWNGTGQSYDGHTGSDYSGGPRGKPVYAAAGGIIVAKVDGFGDQEGTANGNYVKLNHGNDRAGNPINTWYLHLTVGSLTTKTIGEYVAPGELLGGVGTSGNSTGLHLHFHVAYDGAAFDPYAASGETTWWFNQGLPPSTTPAPNKFAIGQFVQAFALSGGTLTVRSPDPTSSSIGTQVEGAIGQVIAGPVLSYLSGDYNNNVYNRYKVRFANGMEGWAAQNWLKDASVPDVAVVQGATALTDGQASAFSFGSVEQGNTGVSRAFTVTNSGGQALTPGAVSVPTGYTLTEGLSASLAPGASDTFTVRLDSATPGAKSGQISFSNNDPDENPFNFPITGSVVADTTGPTADIVDIAPDPWTGPLTANVTIVFNETVVGFTRDDIVLRRNSGIVPLTAAQTLTTSDNVTFTLGNLVPLTQASGTYVFTISGGVTDGPGNAMTVAATESIKIQTNLFRGDANGVTNDTYQIRRSLDGLRLDVWENVVPFDPIYTLPWASLASLTFDTGGGNNTLTISYTRGDPIPAGAPGLAYLGSGGSNTLTLVGGGTLSLQPQYIAGVSNLTLNVGTSTVLLNESQRLAGLTIGATGLLDLRDNALVIDYLPPTTPLGGWNGGAYDGLTGLVAAGRITSTPTQTRGVVGITEASDALGLSFAQTTTWHDQTVDATSILLAHTNAGDANLDRTIDGDDYFAIDANPNLVGGAIGYRKGDFDFNGRVDADDYFLIDANYGKPPIAAALANIPAARRAQDRASSNEIVDGIIDGIDDEIIEELR